MSEITRQRPGRDDGRVRLTGFCPGLLHGRRDSGTLRKGGRLRVTDGPQPEWVSLGQQVPVMGAGLGSESSCWKSALLTVSIGTEAVSLHVA